MTEEWTTSSNEALRISLVRSEDDKKLLRDEETYEDFHPTFTYPIYGEDETVYGYKNLDIDLRLASGSLATYISVNHSAKLPASTVDDVEGTLSQFVPPGYFSDLNAFNAQVEADAIEFKPYGERIGSYKRSLADKGKGKAFSAAEELGEESEDTVIYEAYHATWDTPGFREYHRKMQLFILLYIEAGSYIQEDEEGWEFVVLYEKRRRRDASRTPVYHFVGYSTLFPFFHFPDQVRLRLSQFVIATPYQRAGHGSSLYNLIYAYVLSQPRVAELTVEDPAEAFEDLRDKNDLRFLLNHTKFISEALGVTLDARGHGAKLSLIKGKGKLGPPVVKGWAEKWRQELKFASRQFKRLIEMLIFLHLNHADSQAVRAYRLQVKERLFKFNYEILAQLEKQERLEKLEETFQTVRQDYQRITATI